MREGELHMKQLERDTSPRPRTGTTVRTKLASIAEIAEKDKDAKFNSLAYLMNKNTFKEAFNRLNKDASSGVDKVTCGEYEGNLEENIKNLIIRLKQNSYIPLPVKRVYIPKDGGDKSRPLGIPSLEDKIVQTALTIILESIYEIDFLPMSFGFRPNKDCHKALQDLSRNIGTKKVEYIVDADIRGFFDNVDHEWLMKFLRHRVSDSRLLSLIKRFLKAGILEKGELTSTIVGVPQGGSISPLLGNVYLHYVLDLWFEKVVKKHCKGECYLTRYADDSVACFQYKEDAERYYTSLKKRLGKFKLSVADEKTRIIRFGRFAERDCKREGEGKPDTFDFLGFTHYCGRSRKGRFKLKWKTARKKFVSKVNAFNKWMRTNHRLPLQIIWEKVNLKLVGHYNYYGVSDNWKSLLRFKREVEKKIYYWLKRRSQRNKLTWDKFNNILKNYPLKDPKVLINLNSAFV
jgi:group II intron reverse transcriptase/maturase